MKKNNPIKNMASEATFHADASIVVPLNYEPILNFCATFDPRASAGIIELLLSSNVKYLYGTGIPKDDFMLIVQMLSCGRKYFDRDSKVIVCFNS